jgi:cytoplasmic iron level regulating protein YaaA (DUF328/UPF0246 family)
VLILLPPSEGKRTPQSGRALNLGKLFAASALKEARESALGKNPQIDTTICQPAHEIYSGVLYQSLDWESLSATATKKGEASLLIISAIFGALRITDVIPTYKAKIKSALWKEPLTEFLDAQSVDLIIDFRSSTYMGVWSPPVEKTVAVRVFQVKSGKRSVITHMSKKYRGELVRQILQGKVVNSPTELLALAKAHFACELTPATKKDPYYLDLLIPA